MRISATAPAKLVLMGEYAVTEGAPAVVAAVDRRVRVTVELRPEGAPWRVRTSPTPAATELVPGEDGGFHLANGSSAMRAFGVPLLWHVVAEVLRHLGGTAAGLPPIDVHIDSAELYADEAGRRKLGLGSSAAVVVALGGALRRALDLDISPERAFLADLRAHRNAQGGRGSGADVAASFRGGVIGYEMPNDEVPSPRVTPLAWPSDLGLRCVFTGESADTREFLRAAETCRQTSPRAYRTAMTVLEELAGEALDALGRKDVQAWLALVDRYRVGLARLGETIGAEIVSPVHRRLTQLASAQGVRYKPSGAGGGDVGVAFSDSPDALARAAADMRRAGFEILVLEVDPAGVKMLGGSRP